VRALEDVLGSCTQENDFDMRLQSMFALQGKSTLHRGFASVVTEFTDLDFASQLVVHDKELRHSNLLRGL
jgi:hypothetical protein